MKHGVSRREFLRTLGLGAAALAVPACSPGVRRASAAPAARPNIIFVYSDDHAYQAISAYGSKVNKTPNIDRLGREGMRFDECYVTNSICGPMRAVVVTGKYSHLNGFWRNGLQFDVAQQTFPKLLQKAGYQTAIIGKYHLGRKLNPQGFDYYEILIGQGPYYNPPMRKIGHEQPVKHTGYTTDIITDLALEWLKNGRDKSKPFMLMYQHKAPHRNWQPGPKHLAMYDGVTIPEPDSLFESYEGRPTAVKTQDMTISKTMNRNDLKLTPQRGLTPEQRKPWDAAYGPKNKKFEEAKLQGKDLVRWKYQRYIKDYLRCIASIDDNLGRVLEYLDSSGLAANTIVIYSSDQGFYLRSGSSCWSAGPASSSPAASTATSSRRSTLPRRSSPRPGPGFPTTCRAAPSCRYSRATRPPIGARPSTTITTSSPAPTASAATTAWPTAATNSSTSTRRTWTSGNSST